MLLSKGDILECNRDSLTVYNTDHTSNKVVKGTMFIVYKIEDSTPAIYLFNPQNNKSCRWFTDLLVKDITNKHFIHHPV